MVSIGGPFFDMDVALGNPVCLTIAGRKGICQIVRKRLPVPTAGTHLLLRFRRGRDRGWCPTSRPISRELRISSTSATRFPAPFLPFRRRGKIPLPTSRGNFQAFQSQAAWRDMYITLSSDASKNHRYGRFFYELFTGNSIETSEGLGADRWKTGRAEHHSERSQVPRETQHV